MADKNFINWDAYVAEEAELESLSDPEEAAIRKRMLYKIYESTIDYNAHINDYNYMKHCRLIESRGLVFKTIAKRTATEKWDHFFASHLSAAQKRKIFYSRFKWHMFSYEMCDAIEGDAANDAFDLCQKDSAYLFIQCTDEAWKIKNANLLTAADLNVDYSFERADVYIFDTEGKWFYVRTHERACGPYFFSKVQL